MKLDFYKGADISGLPELEDRRVMIRTAEGQEMDAFELCRQNGVNSIRLRIWNEPEIVPEAKGYCSLEHTIAMAKRIKEKGMHFLLDFHYSDWWADPGNQTKPHAWTNLHGEDLEKAVYDYTAMVIARLKEEGCMPDMVQVGNEIRSGMLFPDGEANGKSVTVEWVNNEMVVTETDALTNHYLAPEKYGVGNDLSKTRFDSMKQAKEENDGAMTQEELKEVMKSVSQGNYVSNEVTQWTVLYNTKEMSLEYFWLENFDHSEKLCFENQ